MAGLDTHTISAFNRCNFQYRLVMIRAVKRFFLILLIMLLPIQMSWAAIHVCDDDAGPVSYVQVMEQSAHDHDFDAASASSDKTHSADTCCVTGHGCHGLHSLMASESSHDAFAVSTHAFNALHSQLAGGAYSARHERPKWPAA